MDQYEESFYREFLLSLCKKLRCTPEELTYLYSFGDDLNKVFKKLVYQSEFN